MRRMRVDRTALAVLWLSAFGAAGVGFVTWPRLFDSTPPGVGRLVSARCAPPLETPCAVKTLETSPNRYWLEAGADGADGLSLDFALPASGEAPRVLLLGVDSSFLAIVVEHTTARSSWQPVATEELSGRSRRRLVRLSGIASGDRVRVTLERVGKHAESTERLRVEEVGLFATEAGLLGDVRWFLRDRPDREVYGGVLARACLWLAGLGTLGAFWASSRGASWGRAAFVLCLTLAATSLELWVEHNPYWYRARDVRVMLASGPVQYGVGANLNYGMYLGSRLLQGEGVTFGPGWVPWERMPGYGFFGALAGLVAGFKTDLFTIGLASIKLHLLLFALANTAFAAAAARVMRPGLAVTAALLVAFMPNQLANTQADSIMVAVYLLTAAALCLYLDREQRQGAPPPLGYHLLVHLSFAAWFLMRPEGVVGWAALSLILYWRRPRYLVLFAAFYLAIGVSWALYKRQYTGEFSMTTNTIGDNAWISLWQAPNDKFRWRTADESYFEFESHLDAPRRSKRASDLAFREVVRFAATYPVYVAHVALHKFVRFVDVDAFEGVVTYPHLAFRRLRGPAIWLLMGVVTLCLCLPGPRRRALFLGWPIFFNLPLFLFFYLDGMRHVAPVTAALLIAGVVPLAEGAFYREFATHWRCVLGVAVLFVALWFLLHWADGALLASHRWRYWTPFLDPSPFQWYLR
jgi:hypothetical protein